MHPAYFALVMATGIVSIACHVVGLRVIAISLFVLNVALYAVVSALTLARIVLHRARVVADILHHGRAVGFFTTVAATCVLGSQFLVIGSCARVALVFWGLGASCSGRSSRTPFSPYSP